MSISVGFKGNSRSSGEFEVIELLQKHNCKVLFKETGTVSVQNKYNTKKGTIRDVYKRTCHGVGYLGDGNYRRSATKAGMYWQFMMNRCYDGKYKLDHPTYENCLVCEEWHNFQNFAEWCVAQRGYGYSGFNLDKDLLVKGNKIYSPETCSLIPQEINKAITKQTMFKAGLPIGVSTREDLGGKFMARLSTSSSGVRGEVYLGLFDTPDSAFLAYKKAKEAHVKLLANKFKGMLADNSYEALMNFEVNIDD